MILLGSELRLGMLVKSFAREPDARRSHAKASDSHQVKWLKFRTSRVYLHHILKVLVINGPSGSCLVRLDRRYKVVFR